MITKKYYKLGLMLLPLWFSKGTSLGADQTVYPIISAKIKCLSMSGDITGVDLLTSQGKRVPIGAPSSYISKAFAYVGPSKLVLVKALKKPGANQPAAESTSKVPAAPETEILASIEIPPPGGDFLLLFAGDTQTKLHLLAVPFSATDVPPGSCLVWNITPRTLGVVMGSDKALLSAEQKRVFKPVAMAKDYFDLRVFDEYQGQSRALVGGPHFLPDQSRQLIFIVERTPGQAPIQIKVVEEMPEIADKKLLTTPSIVQQR